MADAPRLDNLNKLIISENALSSWKTINRGTTAIHQSWCIFGISSDLRYTLVLSLVTDTHIEL